MTCFILDTPVDISFIGTGSEGTITAAFGHLLDIYYCGSTEERRVLCEM